MQNATQRRNTKRASTLYAAQSKTLTSYEDTETYDGFDRYDGYKEPQKSSEVTLSDEQQKMIKCASIGLNVLVDACIGSGKTTTIQALCKSMPEKKILYLTYNRLLKEDARAKIKCKNTEVTNYHGFAFKMLKSVGKTCGISDLIQDFLKTPVQIPHYDMLVIDEYQDIEQEMAAMLERIKDSNPGIQIVMVGDMAQKIYDKTTLNVVEFVNNFLGDHTVIAFTKCFRLSGKYAKHLQTTWGKKITGTNTEQKTEVMSMKQAEAFLKEHDPAEILCLGQRTGDLAKMLNNLEKNCPEKFNKTTVYASIRDRDSDIRPTNDSAIFTTYDASKGLERPICMIFDFQESYWNSRIKHPDVNPYILRNIFCVATSRGKERIIFVKNNKRDAIMEIERIKEMVEAGTYKRAQTPFNISNMFDFKYIEDVEECYHMLQIEEIPQDDHSIIDIKREDAMIDLSPCIGIYQEAMYFNGFDIDGELELRIQTESDSYKKDKLKLIKKSRNTIDEKILLLVGYDTEQERYTTQVDTPFVTLQQKQELINRLKTEFTGHETVQVGCTLDNPAGLIIKGITDVIKGNCIYELKFVSDLQHTHFLQLACYLVATGMKEGVLWNVRNNSKWKVSVPQEDREKFVQCVIKTITKHAFR